jgi:hypothetical protein
MFTLVSARFHGFARENLKHSLNKEPSSSCSKSESGCSTKKAVKSNLAYLQDKIEMITDKSLAYGTQLDKDPKTNNFYVLPVKDKANLNKRRESMDLSPMEVVMKEFNINEIR